MNNLKILLLVFLTIALCFSVSAFTPTWSIDIESSLSGYSATFTAGAGSGATDDYDPNADVQQPPAKPSGGYIEINTKVGDIKLIADNVADLEVGAAKTWEIRLLAFDPSYNRFSGTNTLTWSGSDFSNLNLRLIDYGKDSSRTNVVETIDIKAQSYYELEVNEVIGQYRYLDLVVEATCVEDWVCTEWSKCRKKTQTRSCTDQNNCGTVDNKPVESQECNPGSSGGSDICTPQWKCTKWSKCADNTRTRECTDENQCNDDSTKPAESKDCVSERGAGQTTSLQISGEETAEQSTTAEKSAEEMPKTILTEISKQGVNPFIGILIIVVIVGVGLGIFFVIDRRRVM